MSDPPPGAPQYPPSPSAKQHKSGIPASPRPSPPPPPPAAAVSPGGGGGSSNNISPTRYSLRFVTSSPGTSPTKQLNRSSSADHDGARGGDVGQDLHGESIAYDLSGLAVQQSPRLGDVPSSPDRKQGASGGISASSSYIIRPRKFSDSEALPFRNADAAEHSPDSSSDGDIEAALDAARKRTASVGGKMSHASPAATGNPFGSAPGVPPLTPMTDVVELTPTVEAAVKAARKVTGSTAMASDGDNKARNKMKMVDSTGNKAFDTKGDVWNSEAFRSIIDSADCIMAVELGDRNYLKQRYEDAIECYEEGLDLAYTSLRNLAKQKALADRSRTSASSSFLDDDMPSDEEGGPPEEKYFDAFPLMPQ